MPLSGSRRCPDARCLMAARWITKAACNRFDSVSMLSSVCTIWQRICARLCSAAGRADGAVIGDAVRLGAVSVACLTCFVSATPAAVTQVESLPAPISCSGALNQRCRQLP